MDGITEITFVDDNSIIVTGNLREKIEKKGREVIMRMILWCGESKLSLSASKTVMQRLKRKYERTRPLTINVNG